MKTDEVLRHSVVLSLWNFKLTRQGQYLIVAGLFCGFFSISFNVPVYILLVMLFLLGFVSLVINLCYRTRFSISGDLPEKAVAGQEVQAEVTITNLGRFCAYDVSAGFIDLPAHLKKVGQDLTIPVLPRGESETFIVKLMPQKRGIYKLPPIRAFTTFPFGILRSGKSKKEMGTLLVQPAFHPVDDIDVPVSPRYQPGGLALTSHIGESPEYIGNREFRPGDSTRRIDFHAWARLGKPAIREFQEEYYCRLALVLDTYVPGVRRRPTKGFKEFEAAVSLGASIADALSKGEYIIDIFAAGPELYVFRSGRHTAHLENVLEILACVDECRRNPFEKIAPALSNELGNISTVIFIFLNWDESRKQMVRLADEAGCQTKTFVVCDKEIEDADSGEFIKFTSETIQSGGIDIL